MLQEVDNLEELWTTGKEAIKEEAMAVLGQRRVAKQDWATAEMLDACDEKRQAKRIKNTMPSEENKRRYREKCRTVERESKRAKEKWIEDQCKSCEESFRRGHVKRLFELVGALTREWKHNTMAVRNEQGEKTSNKEEVKRL